MIRDEIRSATESIQHSKGGRTRKRLLDAAAAEVARCGVAGTSINAIAAAAGLKTGSIYFHFESKDRLVEAMLEQGLLASLAYLDAARCYNPRACHRGARTEQLHGRRTRPHLSQ